MSADHPEDTNHGDSIAAWSSVIVIILGVAGLTATYIIKESTGMIVSSVVIVAGIIIGPVLKALGFGVKN